MFNSSSKNKNHANIDSSSLFSVNLINQMYNSSSLLFNNVNSLFSLKLKE